MQKFNFAILLTSVLFLFAMPVKAQISVNLNLNTASQPVWGPVGYDEVHYYYLPDADAYYDVSSRNYYYNDGGRWVKAYSLPARYHFDPYNSYKVVINDDRPWLRHANYKEKYYSFRGHRGQQIIRDSEDSRYFVNKKHPKHNQWIKDNGNNGNGNGNNGKGHKNKGNGNNGNGNNGKHKGR